MQDLPRFYIKEFHTSERCLCRAATKADAKDKIALSTDIEHELTQSYIAGRPSVVECLTPREFEILRTLLAELTLEEIAQTLHVSLKTITNTRIIIKAKLGVGSDIELVRLVLREGLFGIEPISSSEP